MLTKRISFFLMVLAFLCVTARAQDATSQQPTATPSPDAQQQQEEKLKLERKATALLEQLVAEAQGLKLPENRIRVQITAGDMLWSRDAARARGLFSDAGVAVGQMTVDADRSDRDEMQTLVSLRRDLVLTAGRHDGELAYQLLRSTQPPPVTAATGNGRRNMNFPDQSAALEQTLLSVVAATDPKFAYQKAVEALDKGEYPTTVARVLSQLQSKDKEAFDKLTSKVLSKLGSDNLLSSRDAGTLALSLLRQGPRPAESSTGTSTTSTASNGQVLSESAYHDLMDGAITAALTATKPAPGSNYNSVTIVGGPGGRGEYRMPTNQGNPPDEAQVQQNNARTLLNQMQMMLPQIDQYLPDRAQAVRQKLTELGMGNNNQQAQVQQMVNALRGNGTSDSLMTAAAAAPQQMQPRLYQQAAQKAIDEGNLDRAVQIAGEHLDEPGRNNITQAVELKKMAIDPTPEKLNEIRLKLAALPTDSDRVKTMISLASMMQKDNPKLAVKFLDDARILVGKRATNYRDFEDQLSVADAYAAIDPKRSFEVLEPGITQLNELLAAAAILSGFEVDVFHEGELPIQGGSELGNMVVRYGYELASLSKLDFDHAKLTADRFQLAEPRLLVKLAIVQLTLGAQQNQLNRRPQNIQVFSR